MRIMRDWRCGNGEKGGSVEKNALPWHGMFCLAHISSCWHGKYGLWRSWTDVALVHWYPTCILAPFLLGRTPDSTIEHTFCLVKWATEWSITVNVHHQATTMRFGVITAGMTAPCSCSSSNNHPNSIATHFEPIVGSCPKNLVLRVHTAAAKNSSIPTNENIKHVELSCIDRQRPPGLMMSDLRLEYVNFAFLWDSFF